MDPATRRERVQLARLWFLAAVAALLFAPVVPTLARLAPACPMHVLTGLPCPTCGTTRAALALFAGDPLGALRLNPLAALAGGVFLLGGLTAPLWLTRLRPGGSPGPRWVRVALPLGLAVNWIYLVLAGI